MSKKMMKRSLALGALMAFVITGNAMAADTEPLGRNTTIENGILWHDGTYNGNAKDYVLGEYTLTIDSNAIRNGEDYQHAVKATDYSFVGGENSALIIKAGEGKTVTYGLGFYGTVDVGTLDITSDSNAIQSLVGETVIKANTITLTSTKGDGISTTEGGSVNIQKANSLVIDAGDDAISATGGDITVNANDVTLIADSAAVKANGKNVTVKDFEKFTIKESGQGIVNAGYSALNIESNKANSKIDITATGDAVVHKKDGRAGSITVKANDIDIVSTNGRGIYVEGHYDSNKKPISIDIEATNDLTITASASKYAVFLNDSDHQVTANIGAGNDLTINGQSRLWNGKDYSVYGKNINIIAESGNGLHLYMAQANISASELINIETKGNNGLVVQGNYGTGTQINASKISIEAAGNAILAEEDNATYGTPKVVLTANEFVIDGNITANNSGFIDIGDDVSATGYVANITGDIASASTATVNVNLGKEGSLIGQTNDDYMQAEGDKGIHLNLGEGSTWEVTGSSKITELLGSNGNVKLNDLETTVEVAQNNTDGLTVSTSSDNLGSDVGESMEALNALVTCGEEGVADTLVFTAGKYYEDVVGEVNEETGEIKITKDKTINATNLNISDAAALGMMSWRAEMNDMNKRMGELRNANGEHGVWVRIVRGEDEYKSVNHDYTQYQLGYDEKLSVDERWTVGMALSYTDGETAFAKGNGENTNKALSIYGSKLNADGTFVDLIAKYARLENEFNVTEGIGGGEYSTNGYSVSAEFGKRIQQGKGLWIEPQVELSYGKVSAVDYVTKNDVNVAQDSMESIVGRVGLSIGKDIEKGNVYARASYLYDFDGETSVNLDGRETLEQDLGGGWWEVGVGANINLSKATYIYADVEKTFGGEVDTNWQWNLGVRYSF